MPRRSNQLYYLGIDPGKNGGLVAISSPGKIEAIPMPATERDIWQWFQRFGPDDFAVIESVHSMPKQGVASSFTFGVGYGGLRMALIAAGIPFEAVAPRAWQKSLSITPRKKTETNTQWKHRLRARAQELFPRENVTLKTADALLIAEFCRREKHYVEDIRRDIACGTL